MGSNRGEGVSMTIVIQGYHWPTVGEALHDIAQDADDIRVRGWRLADKIRDFLSQFGKNKEAVSALYDALVEHTNLSRQTLLNLASVAKKFPPDERSEALSISHHVALLGVVDEDQLDYLMDEAESKGLSVRTVRAMAHAPVAVRQTANGDYVPDDEEPPFSFNDSREYGEGQRVICPHCGHEWIEL
jgi:hypothetical protein